jgi:hypothetical protein
VRGECVLRNDNEVRNGDHLPFDGKEGAFIFTTPFISLSEQTGCRLCMRQNK